MTPADFGKARQKLGLTQKQLAHVIGVNMTTVQRYEAPVGASSARKVPGPVERIMRWLLGGYRPPEWPKSE